jgi:hypothetical protein
MEKKTIHIVPKYIIYSFFILGLISAIAFRAIIVIQRLEPAWIRPVWYTGTIGYFFFFLYRYIISERKCLFNGERQGSCSLSPHLCEVFS